MIEVTIQFANVNGDGLQYFLVESTTEVCGIFHTKAWTDAAYRAMAAFAEEQPDAAIQSISMRETANKVLRLPLSEKP